MTLLEYLQNNTLKKPICLARKNYSIIGFVGTDRWQENNNDLINMLNLNILYSEIIKIIPDASSWDFNKPVDLIVLEYETINQEKEILETDA